MALDRMLGRYALVRPAGRGGMGEVWLARDTTTNTPCAVKTVRGDLNLDAAARGMLIDEARIARRIEHPNVATVLDAGEHEGAPYLVLEWVEGRSLRELMRETRVPLGIALRIVADACAGLHAAHELRGTDGAPLDLVHRDVSPHNILVSNAGVTKLIDFGIAKARERIAADTSSGIIKGKVR